MLWILGFQDCKGLGLDFLIVRRALNPKPSTPKPTLKALTTDPKAGIGAQETSASGMKLCSLCMASQSMHLASDLGARA